jgi:hypothetical protein
MVSDLFFVDKKYVWEKISLAEVSAFSGVSFGCWDSKDTRIIEYLKFQEFISARASYFINRLVATVP